MAAYADLSYEQMEQLGSHGGFRIRGQEEDYSGDLAGGNESIGLATAFMNAGDTLQSASSSLKAMGLTIERFYDPELGIVIGEKTPLMPARNRNEITLQKKNNRAQRSAAPPNSGSPPAEEDQEMVLQKKATRAQRSAAPGALPPMQPQQQTYQQAPSPVDSFPRARDNMFGIGLKIADFHPHKVLSVNNLRDERMQQINHMVQKGDILLYINETPVEQLNIDELEWHIFGRKGEMVVLALYRPSNGQTYNIRVNRHIPIQFALGMSVTREPPYSVKRVDELLDPNNENIGDMVEAGDLIESVNGRNCMMEKVRVLEDIIFGPIDSHCTIVFKSLRSASNYKVTFKRHIPVSSWVRWEEQGGMHAAMAPPLKQTPPFMQAPVVPMSQVSVAAAPNGGSLKGFEADDVTGEFI